MDQNKICVLCSRSKTEGYGFCRNCGHVFEGPKKDIIKRLMQWAKKTCDMREKDDYS